MRRSFPLLTPSRIHMCPHLGQEVYFLGYPYGLYTTFGDQGGVALIKHACISARVACSAIYPDGDKDTMLILLDGLNNPGFSGGPIVAPDIFCPHIQISGCKSSSG